MQKKSVMILTPFYKPTIGGAETFVSMLENKLENNIVATINQNRFAGKPFSGTGIKQFIQIFPELFISCNNALSRNEYIHTIYACGLLSAIVAILVTKIRKPCCKVYLILLALYDFDKKPNLFKRIARRVLSDCDRVYVEGENGNEDIKCLIWNGGIPFTHWVEDRFFIKKKSRKGKITVGFVGRDIPIKGKSIFDSIAKDCKNSDIEFISATNLEHSKLHEFLHYVDILLVPSLYSEGHTRIICEAAASGCAIIASNRGSLPEQVKGFGISVEPTIDEFRKTLDFLISDTSHLRYMQSKTRLYAKKIFTDKNAEVFL